MPTVRSASATTGPPSRAPQQGAFDWGLTGIPIYEFALVGETLRIYPGWAPDDFARFKNMMETYLYPLSHDFLTGHNNSPITHYWANWDLCNMDAVLAIGVLCDDHAKYDEAIEYFKHGAGNGSIEHAVPFIYPGGLAQWQEMGRDQEHTQLGIGMMAMFCQVAWNQGLDLFSYDNNRLLAGAEYIARYNLWKPVPYTPYTNEDHVNQYWPSALLDAGRGRLQRPIWELLYNHYVVLKGLNAPDLTEMASSTAPKAFSTTTTSALARSSTRSTQRSRPTLPPPRRRHRLGLPPAWIGIVLLNWSPCKARTDLSCRGQRRLTARSQN